MPKFTNDQIKSFNDYQQSGVFHPFTCGSGRRTDKDHLDGEGLLVMTPDDIRCPYCDYVQDKAHTFMLDNSWRKQENIMKNIWITGVTRKEIEK